MVQSADGSLRQKKCWWYLVDFEWNGGEWRVARLIGHINSTQHRIDMYSNNCYLNWNKENPYSIHPNAKNMLKDVWLK